MIAITILASNDQEINIIELSDFLLIIIIIIIIFFLWFIERAEQLDAYLYIILDWNIFFLTILCIFLRRNFKVLSYNVFFGRDLVNKYNTFSDSKIIVWIIVITILTKIIVIMIFPIIEQPSFIYNYSFSGVVLLFS